MCVEINFYQIAQKIIKKYFVYKTDKERHRDCLLVVPLTNGIHTTTKVQLIVECVKYGCLQLQKIIGFGWRCFQPALYVWLLSDSAAKIWATAGSALCNVFMCLAIFRFGFLQKKQYCCLFNIIAPFLDWACSTEKKTGEKNCYSKGKHHLIWYFISICLSVCLSVCMYVCMTVCCIFSIFLRHIIKFGLQ